uniref:Tetraspanin-18-like isoform X2 n=1 Tax=Crassostrea virginica TaxID=6565 RepID=A0A8B8D0G8_CRAVI|nr:tetraspanin-18-like isoform X2 [Crassostrea virginica]
MSGSNSDDGYLKSQGERGAYVLLHMKAVLMVAAIALISSSVDISTGNPCELKEALDLISLNYAPFCKYNATIEESGKVFGWGIAVFCGHSILFLVILSACMWPSENKRIGFLIIYIVDYERLNSEMLHSLEKQFTSDDHTNGDTVSSGWNKLFIKYNCCAVNEVQGTTNDFDNTPWCTTSGTCEDTYSQIPKTCCRNVTLDNYREAPDTCHASVNPGTFKPACFQVVKSMSLVNVEAYQVSMLSLSLFMLTLLQILDLIIVLAVVPFVIYDIITTRKSSHFTK